MNNFFDKLNDGIRNVETSFVNFISAVAPWMAPLSPAYMTYDHAVKALGFPVWVALPVAIVVEILGFSAISTFVTFWFFNRRNKAEVKKAPTGWVIFAFIFYLALIVTSNILLDAYHNAEWAKTAVRALFTLQTIPAAVIVVARAGHKSLLGELANERANEQSVALTEMRKKLKESEDKLKSSEMQLTTTEEKFRASEAELSAMIIRINSSEEKIRLSEDRARESEQRAKIAEERFGALGDLVKYLFSENKRERIVAAHRQWPQLPGNAIAIITGATQSYVSQVLTEADLVEVGEGD
jgi:hypothetical protein